MEWEVKVDMAEYMCPKIHVIANVFNKEKKNIWKENIPQRKFFRMGGNVVVSTPMHPQLII